jgi:predicted DNA-binding transcriptional regulator AlpA
LRSRNKQASKGMQASLALVASEKWSPIIYPASAREPTMIAKRLRFQDLLDKNIVQNRTTLNNWIEKYGFPEGQLTGPNTRTWSEPEIQEWLDSRPTAAKPEIPLKPGSRRGRKPLWLKQAEKAAQTTPPPKTAPPARARTPKRKSAAMQANA